MYFTLKSFGYHWLNCFTLYYTILINKRNLYLTKCNETWCGGDVGGGGCAVSLDYDTPVNIVQLCTGLGCGNSFG